MIFVSRRLLPAARPTAPFFLIALTSGCVSYSPAEVAKPSTITLDAALQDVVSSLHRAQDRYPPKERFGLLADQIEVSFEIAASAQNGGKQTLNIAQVPIGGTAGAGSVGAEGSQTANANRGNTIKIIFKNMYTADMSKGLLAQSKGQQKSNNPQPAPDDCKKQQPNDHATVPALPTGAIILGGQLDSETAKKLQDILKNGQPSSSQHKC